MLVFSLCIKISSDAFSLLNLHMRQNVNLLSKMTPRRRTQHLGAEKHAELCSGETQCQLSELFL